MQARIVAYNSHCNKKAALVELPLSVIRLNTSTVHTCTEVEYHIYFLVYNLACHGSLV